MNQQTQRHVSPRTRTKTNRAPGDKQSLDEQVRQLRVAFAEQQTLLAQQRAEIDALRTQIAASQVPASAATDTWSEAARTHDAAAAHTTSSAGDGHNTSRRSLLKWGGAAAAAVTLAASGRQAAHAAAANDNSNLVLGQSNTATSETSLAITGTSSANSLFNVDASASTITDAIAIEGVSNVADGIGVAGFSTGSDRCAGVYGNSTYASVWGENDVGVFGVLGQSFNSISGAGVTAYTDGGYGVVAISGTGIDLNVGAGVGQGRLFQQLQVSAGPPSSGNYLKGEQIRDSAGVMYICTASGGPGTWERVASFPSSASGGAPVLFATPYRIFDTRDLTGVPFNNGTGNNPMTPSQIKTLQITGIVDPNDATIVVPTGATGIIGNLIAITPSGEGFLGIQPSTGSANSRAWVNYEANVSIDNAVIVGLSTDGKIDIQCNTADAGAALTITGYIA